MRSARHRAGAAACLALLWAAPARALDPAVLPSLYGHDAWTTDQGLPESSVQTLARTPDGYLWVGTQEGLARFDGRSFTVFDKRNAPALGDPNITALQVDPEGTLWVGTFSTGLARMKNGAFEAVTDKQGLPDRSVMHLRKGARGRILVATPKGLAIIEGGRIAEVVTPPEPPRSALEDARGVLWVGSKKGLQVRREGAWKIFTRRDGLVDDRVDSLFEDGDGSIWVGTKNGGFHRFVEGKLAETLRLAGSTAAVREIHRDRDGNLWLGTEGRGLVRYAGGRFERFGPAEGLVGANVWSLLEDPEGSLWVATSGGLNRLKDQNIHTYGKRQGVPHDYVWVAHEDEAGAIWLGLGQGGLHRLDPRGGPGKTYTKKDGLFHETVMTLLRDRRGILWVATFAGLNAFEGGKLRRVEDRTLARHPIKVLHEDERGDLWLGTEGGGVIHFREGRVVRVYTKKDGLLGNRIYALAGDGNGGLWVGSIQGGLNRLRPDGRIESYGPREGFTGLDVDALYRDATGALWIGTYGAGLFRFHEGRFTAYTASMGLFDDRVFQIFEEADGWMWLTCNRGVFRVRKAELEAVARGERDRIASESFGRHDGMASPECNGGGTRSRDGRLWLPTTRGVAVFHPNRWKRNPVPPPVILEKVLVDGRPLDVSIPGDLEAGSSAIELHAAGLSYLVPERVRYRFKLEGFDADFVEAGTRRVAYYTNLDPGHYRFVVQATNNDGVWSPEGASFSFRLRPHFYQTSWFYGLCAALVVGAAFASHRLRIRQLKARERVLERLVKERTRQLAEANEKLWAEMALAKQIQLAILPPEIELADLDVFGMMVPADEVGGDYFDVQVGADGRAWFMIGDVSGHGVTSGLIMMMAQTAVATALQRAPGLRPDELLGIINEPLRDNVQRLKESKFLTLTALAYEGDGQFAHAGLHQDLLVWRAGEKRVEALETTGAWVAMMPDLGEMVETQRFFLGEGDVLVLYTDGVTEAPGPEGAQYGAERFVERIGALAAGGLEARPLTEALVADVLRFSPNHDDDISVLVIRRRAARAAAEPETLVA